jgi:hypothetical protein
MDGIGDHTGAFVVTYICTLGKQLTSLRFYSLTEYDYEHEECIEIAYPSTAWLLPNYAMKLPTARALKSPIPLPQQPTLVLILSRTAPS